jgi:hypothetical protein
MNGSESGQIARTHVRVGLGAVARLAGKHEVRECVAAAARTGDDVVDGRPRERPPAERLAAVGARRAVTQKQGAAPASTLLAAH